METANKLKTALLCVTDFSNSSEGALRWSVQMAQQHQSHLTILYPYRLNQSLERGSWPLLRQSLELEAQSNFKKFADHILQDSKVPYELKLEIGFFNDRVYAHTQKNDISMIVISNRMVNNSKEALNELLERLRAPLVIIP